MIEITAIKFFIGLFAISATIIMIIALLRRQMRRNGLDLLKSDTVIGKPYMKQYAQVNVFKYTPIFLRLGMVVSLLLVIFAFNWTTYEREIYIPDVEDLPEIIEIDSRRAPEPPPPLPPPPPVIEEVPEEQVEEEVIFEDQTVEVDEIIAPPEPSPVKPVPPPPLPAPPPIIIEEEEKPEDNIEIFDFVQQMPRFAGCEELDGTNSDKKLCAERKMLKFIYSKINYPTIARENGIEGIVMISFIVEKDGTITSPEILRDIGGGCGKDALRVISQMPNWTPGYQRTQAVRVQFRIPIKFELKG